MTRYLRKLAIYLTQVTPIYSVRPGGGLSAGSRRVRGSVRDGRGVSRVSGQPPLTGGVSVSTVRAREIVAGAGRIVPVCRLWAPDVGDGRHDLSGFADATADLVSRDMRR